jgi:hypothetical protein
MDTGEIGSNDGRRAEVDRERIILSFYFSTFFQLQNLHSIMRNELEMMWKKEIVVVLSCYPILHLEELKKPMKASDDRNSNPGPPECHGNANVRLVACPYHRSDSSFCGVVLTYMPIK